MMLKSAGWMTAAIVVALVAPLAATAGDRHPGTKLAGVVVAVDPTHISMRGGNGQRVTLEVPEDYTQRLAVGAEVTAWYSSQGGVKTLEWLDAPRDSFFVPAGEIRERIKKVVVLPHSELPGTDDLFDAMESYIESRGGWYVASRRLAGEVLRAALKRQTAVSTSRSPSSTLEAINPETGEFDQAEAKQPPSPSQQTPPPPASALEAIDPETGEFDIARYTGSERPKQDQAEAKPPPSPARQASPSPASPLEAIDPATGEFDMTRYVQAPRPEVTGATPSQPPSAPPTSIARIASMIRVDGVLEAEVIEVQAPVSRLVAKWDGAEEEIAGRGSETVAHLALGPGRGSVPAATVILRLWDRQGNLLWTDRTGLAVLAVHEGLGNKMRERPLSEVVLNHGALDRWLASVFTPLFSDSALPGQRARKE